MRFVHNWLLLHKQIEIMSIIKGICIKSYQDEDDLQEFSEGLINEDEIKVYKVGEKGDIVEGLYSEEYWIPEEVNSIV